MLIFPLDCADVLISVQTFMMLLYYENKQC